MIDLGVRELKNLWFIMARIQRDVRSIQKNLYDLMHHQNLSRQGRQRSNLKNLLDRDNKY